MQGKTCLITGATDGIGKQTALGLAKKGAHVVIVGRSSHKTAAVADEIRAAAGHDRVDLLIADLSRVGEVCRLADEFRQRYNRLHVLVNNAGGFYMTRQQTSEGLELTLALNHLSYFVLTIRLLEPLKAAAPARVINVSSGAHLGGQINFDDLDLNHGYSGWKAYSQSKLMNVLFTYELARRLQGSGVTANAVHPGFVATRFGHGNAFWVRWAVRLSQLFALSPEQGAQTPLYLASSPDVEGVSGKYFIKQRVMASSKLSYDEQAARQLWEASEALAELHGCPV